MALVGLFVDGGSFCVCYLPLVSVLCFLCRDFTFSNANATTAPLLLICISFSITKKMQDSTNKKREADDDSDSDFIEVLSPPKKPALSSLAAIPAESAANDDDSNDDDAMVVSSTVINPNVDYPHVRLHCGVVAAYSSETASLFCRNCFCHVCDRPAADCTSWAEHCQQKQVFRDKTISTGEVTVLGPSEGAVAFVQNRRATAMPSAAAVMASMSSTPGMTSGMAAFFMHHYGSSQGGRGMPYYYNSDDDDIFAVGGGRGGLSNNAGRGGAGKGAESKRITDILAENLALLVRFTDDPNVNQTERKQLSNDDFMRTLRLRYENLKPSPMAAELKMEGDISNLCLHNSFFVEGIRIGWPFSSILTPQRQMAIHIIKGLKQKRHVVLESPTGTVSSNAGWASLRRLIARSHQIPSYDRESRPPFFVPFLLGNGITLNARKQIQTNNP